MVRTGTEFEFERDRNSPSESRPKPASRLAVAIIAMLLPIGPRAWREAFVSTSVFELVSSAGLIGRRRSRRIPYEYIIVPIVCGGPRLWAAGRRTPADRRARGGDGEV